MASTTPPPPRPPATSLNGQPTGRQPQDQNGYLIVGLILLFTPLIPGIALYAIVASIFGEEVLESSGDATLLGQVIIFVPNIIGGIIAALAKPLHQRFPLTFSRVAMVVAGLGSICLVAGALSLSGVTNGTEPGDANIGGGVLIVLGVVALVLGSVGLLVKAARGRSES